MVSCARFQLQAARHVVLGNGALTTRAPLK
jgi:hypothetical protein